MGIFIGALVTIIISGGLVMISLAGFSYIAFWSIGVLVLLSIFALSFIVYWYLRLSNRRWEFKTSELPNRERPYFNHIDKSPHHWRSQKPQEKNMTYEILFQRKLTIKSIKFDDGYVFETPRKWRMDFPDRKTSEPIRIYEHRLPFIETGDPETRPDSSEILVELKQPIRADHIRVIVRELEVISGEVKHWRVEAVYVRIKTLFGLEYTIGRHRLDRL